MSSVKIVAVTSPLIEGINGPEEFIAYAARVSNPSNQMNIETSEKLLKYLIKTNTGLHLKWFRYVWKSKPLEILVDRFCDTAASPSRNLVKDTLTQIN